jgi:hypothetical protein
MNLAIFVHDLSPASDFSVEKMMLWLGPLKADRFGVIPIFEAKTINDLALAVNQYQIDNLIIASSYLIEELTETRSEAVEYTIRSQNHLGIERNVLLLPNNEDVEWIRLEPALDRFEELL